MNSTALLRKVNSEIIFRVWLLISGLSFDKSHDAEQLILEEENCKILI